MTDRDRGCDGAQEHTNALSISVLDVMVVQPLYAGD